MPDESDLKECVRNFLVFIDEEGIIEETGQMYKKVSVKTIFDKDREVLYTMIEKLKNLSK